MEKIVRSFQTREEGEAADRAKPRYTGDLDLRVQPAPSNAANIVRALQALGVLIVWYLGKSEQRKNKQALAHPQDLAGLELIA